MVMNTYEIWRSAPSLNQAWYDYSNESLRLEYDELLEPKNLGTEPVLDFSDALIRVSNSLNTFTKRLKRISNLQNEFKADLIEWLKEEELIAYGMPLEPSAH